LNTASTICCRWQDNAVVGKTKIDIKNDVTSIELKEEFFKERQQ